MDPRYLNCKCPQNVGIVQGLIKAVEEIDASSRFASTQMKYRKSLMTALNSISNYPLPLRNAQQALRLNGIGRSIADVIAKILHEAHSNDSVAVPGENTYVGQQQSVIRKDASSNKPSREYCPKEGSAPFFVLVSLHILEKNKTGHGKEEIISCMQQVCDELSHQEISKKWSSIKRKLISKENLVSLLKEKESNSVSYLLSSKGKSLASDLFSIFHSTRKSSKHQANNPGISSPKLRQYVPPVTKETFLCNVEQSSWEITLLVDKRERGFRDVDRSKMLELLKKTGIRCDLSHLELGDMIWVAHGPDTKEPIVLDYIVERKQVSDLCESIKDNRYFEQKYRLDMCECANVLYIIEGDVNKVDGVDIAEGSMPCAIALAETSHQFQIFNTQKLDHTVRILKLFTETLRKRLDSGSLELEGRPTFAEFSSRWKKNEFHNSPEVVYSKQLQMIRGVSMERAIAIQKKFETARILFESFSKTHDEASMLKNLLFMSKGTVPREFGFASSSHISQFFRQIDFKSRLS